LIKGKKYEGGWYSELKTDDEITIKPHIRGVFCLWDDG